MKPNLFVVGPSGTGKSTSLRNLDPKRTVIINTEQKALPFKGSHLFKGNINVRNIDEFDALMDKVLPSDKNDVIVIESFTSLIEQIYRKGSEVYTGFDFWDYYKREVDRVLQKCKSNDKYVVFLGIDQVLEGAGGVEERYIAVDGSWKKKVEKEFVCVLFADMYTDEQGSPKYRFITNKQQGFERVSAKSPMEMFPPVMDNDLAQVIQLMKEYYGDVEPTPAPQQEPNNNNNQ